MKILFWSIFFSCFAVIMHAQTTRVIAFPITDYIVESDSVTIAQVKLPPGLHVKDKSVCLLKSVYAVDKQDSVVTVGSGRIGLVKGDYNYFSFTKAKLLRKPLPGELLYTQVNMPVIYEGLIFDVLAHSININTVTDDFIAYINTALQLKTAADEKKIIDSMVADVQYTGKEMPKINKSQDQMITSGKFKGKMIFASMEAITNDDVTDFLEYMNARPGKYAGHTWKFSEIMATWMAAGAPTVERHR
jgi:hypothetical protein